MGNLEQKMASLPSIEELSKTLKHLEETRPQSEIEITNRLAQLLSDLNTTRVFRKPNYSVKQLDWSDYAFVCIQGLPALENQFDMLYLPGETIYFCVKMFCPETHAKSEAEKLKILQESTIQKETERIHNLLQSIKKPKIVVVYHSAGNLFLSMYFHYYGLEIQSKIKGMIDIGGLPLRYYTSARLLTPLIMSYDFAEIVAVGEKVHKMFLKSLAQTGFDVGFKSKYETLAFLHYIKSPDYGEAFNSTWNHPKILKLFLHGRNDTLFEHQLLCEKIIYHCYKKQLQAQYLAKLNQKYQKLFNPKHRVKNLQDRFVFAVPKGQHSLHRQERNHDLVRISVHQYLAIIHQ